MISTHQGITERLLPEESNKRFSVTPIALSVTN